MNSVEAEEQIGLMIDELEFAFFKFLKKYEHLPPAWLVIAENYLLIIGKKHGVTPELGKYLFAKIAEIFTEEYYSQWRNKRKIKRQVTNLYNKLYKLTGGY